MTEKGSFVINGAERVIVSQLHRSPVFFSPCLKHQRNQAVLGPHYPIQRLLDRIRNGRQLGDVCVHRPKKIPVTTLLRAIGYGTDKDILDLFGLSEEVEATKNALKKW